MGIPEFIHRLPKVDLHIHLEGSLRPSTIVALARRHKRPAPPIGRFSGFAEFLKAFARVSDLLADASDFERAAFDLLEEARGKGVAHVEILFSPQVHLRRGIGLATMMTGLLAARARMRASNGPSCLFLADGVRQWGGEWFERFVRSAAPYAGRGLAGIGVGGDEAGRPATEFRRAYEIARRLGLRATMHAGETRGPESIREALGLPGLTRIGHGIAAAEDPRLIRELAARKILLEICPTSNVATGAVPALGRHPVRRLFDAGVPIAIGSDDGSLFGTDVSAELALLSRQFGFTRSDLTRITLDAARASFLPARRRQALIRRISLRARRLTPPSAPARAGSFR